MLLDLFQVTLTYWFQISNNLTRLKNELEDLYLNFQIIQILKEVNNALQPYAIVISWGYL